MTHAPHDFALVIGINHYPCWGAGGNHLKGAIRDAEKFAGWLLADGGLPLDHVHLLTSTTEPELFPLQPAIDAALKSIETRIKELPTRRRFYFYFSGHGHLPIGSDADRPQLCLPNWSLKTAGATLHLQSYVNAAIGCFGFDEGVFLLDCCQARQVAPIGKTSDSECGSPQWAGRYYVQAFATEPYQLAYEDKVREDGEIQGHFTRALLEILEEGPIAFPDLKARLEELVPVRSKDKQIALIIDRIPTTRAKAMIFGSPTPPPPPGVEPAPPVPDARLVVILHTNLRRDIRPGQKLAPVPGLISVFDTREKRVVSGRGGLDCSLPRGTYRVRIEHGEAVHDEEIKLDNDFELGLWLPRRRSAAPLSSTADKSEWFSDPASLISSWKPRKGEQGLFVFMRPPKAGDGIGFHGYVELFAPNQRGFPRNIGARELVQDLRPGTYLLRFLSGAIRSEGPVTLAIPVARGWDTQVFIVVVDGRPVLERATVLMREAGLGFDPSDALLDAYERALVDLVSGVSDLHKEVLDDLLKGKYRNPLFGLVGAHFLFRLLAKDPTDPELRKWPEVVINNLGKLLGRESPDVQALRLMQAEWLGQETPELEIKHPPLLRQAMLTIFRASAERPRLLRNMPLAMDIALGAMPESPWNCWRAVPFDVLISENRSHLERRNVTRWVQNVPTSEVDLVQHLLSEEEFAVSGPEVMANQLYYVRGDKAPWSDASNDAFHVFVNKLRAPSWLVAYCDDQLERAERLSYSIDIVKLTRRLALPRNLVEAALDVAKARRKVASRLP